VLARLLGRARANPETVRDRQPAGAGGSVAAETMRPAADGYALMLGNNRHPRHERGTL
jgi:hypothetical protein